MAIWNPKVKGLGFAILLLHCYFLLLYYMITILLVSSYYLIPISLLHPAYHCSLVSVLYLYHYLLTTRLVQDYQISAVGIFLVVGIFVFP